MKMLQILLLTCSTIGIIFSAESSFNPDENAQAIKLFSPPCFCIRTQQCTDSVNAVFPENSPARTEPWTRQNCPLKTHACLLMNGCTMCRTCTCMACTCGPLFFTSLIIASMSAGPCVTAAVIKASKPVAWSTCIPAALSWLSCCPTRDSEYSPLREPHASKADRDILTRISNPTTWSNVGIHENTWLLQNVIGNSPADMGIVED